MMAKLQVIVLLALSFASLPGSEAGITCNVPSVVISLTGTEITDDLNVANDETVYVAANHVTTTDDLTAIASECKGVVTTVMWSLTIDDLHKCGAVATDSSPNYLVEYTVWYSTGLKNDEHVIHRPTHRSIKLTCALPEDHTLNLDIIIIPSTAIVETMQSVEAGAFEVSIHAYTTMTEPDSGIELSGAIASGSSITVPDPIYVQVTLEDSFDDATRFNVEITDCFATTTSDATGSPLYDIIDSGCEVTNDFDAADDVAIHKNYMPTDGVFHVNSFLWHTPSGSGQEIYLHCYVTICDTMSTGATCTAPSCLKRKRRELTSDLSDGSRSGTSDQTVSFGPIVLAAEGQSCAENNGGCSDACSIVNTMVKCSCVANRVLASDGKTCLAATEETNDEVLQEMKATENAVYILMVMIVVVIAAAAGFFARSMCFNRKH